MKAILLALLAAGAVEPAFAQPPQTETSAMPAQPTAEERAGLGAVDEFFDAVHDRSRERMAAAILAEGWQPRSGRKARGSL